jgi:hypothetical protein
VVDVAAVYGLVAADAVALAGWLALLVAQSAVLARVVRPASWLLPAYVVAQRWLVVLALCAPRRRVLT